MDKQIVSSDEKPERNSTQADKIMQGLSSLSGHQILDKIMDHEKPRQLVQGMAQGDFYWMVKKVGDDDCLPLLRMASDDQKQYLIDLEFWRKDRIDLDRASQWINRLYLADPRGLARWLCSKGESLAYFYFFNNIQVEIRDEDEDQDLEGLFSLDGTFYVKIPDNDRKEVIEKTLRVLAAEDLDRYHDFLSALGGVIPMEMEEDMFRMRNVRLAEHGFLPVDEAISVYSRLPSDTLTADENADSIREFAMEEVRDLVAVFPLYHAQSDNLLSRAFSTIHIATDLDRIRLEFMGLCNQLISADGAWENDLEGLIRTCQKASGHLNLALEKVCGTSVPMAQKILLNNSLVSIFRVGFGTVLELKWEAERWVKNSWFRGRDLKDSFWGEERGRILKGILAPKPVFFHKTDAKEAYQPFEHAVQLEDCRRCLRQLKALDSMFAHVTETYSWQTQAPESERVTFQQMLFHLWARKLLGMEPGFTGLPIKEIRRFFRKIRTDENNPPYRMPGFEEAFVTAFSEGASLLDPDTAADLRDVLHLIWVEFAEEYAWVASDGIDKRFTSHFAKAAKAE